MAFEHKKIKKKYLVLCEGTDTERFLIFYINSKALKYDSRFSEDIQTFDSEGIGNLTNHIGILKNMENFDLVRRLLILRDAERDVDSAIQSIQSSLRNHGLPVPEGCNQWAGDSKSLSTAFTLMPSCSDHPTTGAIEDLCWEILKRPEMKDMRVNVQRFVNEIQTDYHTIVAHEHKSRLHTLLSVNEDYISLKIGEASKAGAFDWTSEKLSPLRDLLTAGFNNG